jgi:hypothetical protein
MACQSSTDKLPGQLCSSVILTSGPISLTQTAKNCRTCPGRLQHRLCHEPAKPWPGRGETRPKTGAANLAGDRYSFRSGRASTVQRWSRSLPSFTCQCLLFQRAALCRAGFHTHHFDSAPVSLPGLFIVIPRDVHSRANRIITPSLPSGEAHFVRKSGCRPRHHDWISFPSGVHCNSSQQSFSPTKRARTAVARRG